MNKFIGFYNFKINQKKRSTFIDEGLTEEYHSGKFCLFTRNSKTSNEVRFFVKENIVIILLGEILNFDDIAGHTSAGFPPMDPLENMFNLFQRHRESAFDLLDGSFSIAIWDSNNQSIHLSRDDGGTKLLYYRKVGNGLIFSNDISEVIRASGSKTISKKALTEYLRFLDISPPYTIYKDVYFLEPEVVVSMNSSGLETREKKPPSLFDNSHYSDNVASFEDLFFNSIEKRLGLGRNTGVFLSGGIDSSLVCAVAAQLNKNIKAVTVGFDDPRFDESQIAKNIANHLKISHDVFFFSLKQDYQAFFDFTSTIASPFADPAIIPTFQCFKKIESTMDNMFDGTGADTLIGIMPAKYIHFILNFSRHIPYEIRKAIAKALSYSRHSRKHMDLFDYEDPIEPLIRWDGWKKDEISELTTLHYSIEHTMFYKLFTKNIHKTPYEIYSCLMGALPDDRVNQSSAVTDVSVSFPFFDRTIQAHVRKMPMSSRYQKGKSKKLYRDLLGKYIPTDIWDVPKHGFNYQFWELLRYNNYDLLNEFLSKKALSSHVFFDTSIVDKYVNRFKSGDFSVRFKIWGLVLFQSWYKNFWEKL